jgi:hypothetical protein
MQNVCCIIRINVADYQDRKYQTIFLESWPECPHIIIFQTFNLNAQRNIEAGINDIQATNIIIMHDFPSYKADYLPILKKNAH